ncbi:MAG: PAS domain-containing protein, partial [Candidatus Schekmanbacteria bacterium]
MVDSFDDFLQKIANSTAKIEIINYFQNNPSAIDSPQGLSRWINIDPLEIENELEDLVESGILLKENAGTHSLYRYSPRKEFSTFISNLFNARSYYEKKIAELEKEKNSISDRFTKEIIREKGKTKTIIESMNEGILVLNNEAKILTVNSLARDILSIKESDPTGKDFFSIISSDKRKDLMKLISENENGTFEIKLEENKKESFYKVNISELRDDSD